MKICLFALLFFSRTWVVLGQQPVLFYPSYDTICVGGALSVYSVVNDAASYNWNFGDGSSSSAELPPSHAYANTGSYAVSLTITTIPGQFFISSVNVLDHEPYFSLTDPQPDPYLIVLNGQGEEVYRSITNSNLNPPYIIPVALLLTDQPYLFELWDFDLLDQDDGLGQVFIANPTQGGTYTFGNTQLSIFPTAAAASYSSTDTIHVVEPYIVYNTGANLLEVHPVFTSAIYSWYLNGSPIPGADMTTYVPTTTGAYSINVTFGAGCNYTTEPIQVDVVDAPEPAQLQAIQLHPNPVSGILKIRFPEPLDGRFQITISDIHGREVWSQMKENATELSLDCSLLPIGSYAVTFLHKNLCVAKKLVVNR